MNDMQKLSVIIYNKVRMRQQAVAELLQILTFFIRQAIIIGKHSYFPQNISTFAENNQDINHKHLS